MHVAETIEPLRLAILTGRWDEVAALLDKGFFRYLFQAPEVVAHLFEVAPPAFYEAHPRHVISRAIDSASRRKILMVDRYSQSQFSEWVEAAERPLLRDVLTVLLVSIWESLALGWYKSAAEAAGQILKLLSTPADDSAGIDDVAPVALVGCGIVKLIVFDADSALVCFREAVQWSYIGEGHPFMEYARDYLALGNVLCARPLAAEPVLSRHPAEGNEQGSFLHHRSSSRIIAELFVAIEVLEFDKAEDLVQQFDDYRPSGELSWFAMHARTEIALWRGDPWMAIQLLEQYLHRETARTPPEIATGTVLRADLVSLYQAVGDLQSAVAVLRTPGLRPNHPGLLGSHVRQELLCGRPDAALRLLERGAVGAATPARTMPHGAALYAAIEHTVIGSVSPATLQATALLLNHRGTYFALYQVPEAVREALRSLLGIELPGVRAAFEYQASVRLTARECDLLSALARAMTVEEIAQELHISVNTARSHVRTLYRKLGAHSRQEALWLGRGVFARLEGDARFTR